MRKLNDPRYFYAMRFADDGRTLLAVAAGPGNEISAQRFAVANDLLGDFSGRPINSAPCGPRSAKI